MTGKEPRRILQGLTVREAMRRQVISLPERATLAEAARTMLKFKVNAVLVVSDQQEPLGVVSKTDLMTAYYSELPLGSPLAAIMVGPPQFCLPQDSLDAALDRMREYRIHRLYVREAEEAAIIGVLAYPDIVGLLYRYCRQCELSLRQRRQEGDRELEGFYRVKEVMSPELVCYQETDSLREIMGGLAAYRFGAVPIRNDQGLPTGVVSKTDLLLAYLHGLDPVTPAAVVMNQPIVTCDQEELLLEAIRKLIFADLHRLFVYQQRPENLAGVLSLSDATRFRSGSCRACLVSRIKI